MKRPLLSIITINYNNLEGLKKTMSSICEQSFTDFEYIVIDGGSTDGSAAYIESRQSDVDYWVSEKDDGIYHAMNKGIAQARGAYLQFVNSGDWLFNATIIERMIPHLKRSDVIYGNLVKVFPDGSEVIDKGPKRKKINIDTFLWGTLNHGSAYIKAALFQKYGVYDEHLKIVSDWKFFLVALGLNNAKVKYVDAEVLYFDMQGISNTQEEGIREEREQVLKEVLSDDEFLRFREKRRLPETIAERIIRRVHRILMNKKK